MLGETLLFNMPGTLLPFAWRALKLLARFYGRGDIRRSRPWSALGSRRGSGVPLAEHVDYVY